MFYAEYVSKSNYPYWVLIANEPIIKLGVWSCRKLFNATLFTEAQVLELINTHYPDSIRIDRPLLKQKWK